MIRFSSIILQTVAKEYAVQNKAQRKTHGISIQIYLKIYSR